MKDIIPSWLEDPSAYAQPANLDMSTVIVVALTNLWVGIVCVTFFEVFRRRNMRIFSPKATLCPGTCPPVLHVPGAKPGAPLSWVRPLMRLGEDDILRYGGYDVLIYLRFMSLSLKIFGSFAPYAFIVLLPVNASRDDVRQRTILVRQVPRELRSSDALAAYFAKLYPGKVVGAVERAQHHAAQQRTFDERIARERRRQALADALVGKPRRAAAPQTADSYQEAAPPDDDREVAAPSSATRSAAPRTSTSATTTAARRRHVFHAATPGGMVASMAPEPRDVFWKNAELSGKQRTRRVVADCLVVLLLIFYIIPVTLISLVFSEQALKAHWPALKELASDSLAFDACVKMVQPMALIALMLLLPPAFLGLGFWEGTLSWSENTLTQLSRYYSFQITNVLLVTTIAGSLVKCLQKIIDDPQATLSLLGESLPQQALKRCLYPSSTPRDQRAEVLGLRDFENPGWFSYGKYGAQDLLVVVLLMTYCVMSPIILVPGLLFFGWASVVYRHQLLYVYEPIFESGGLLWPRIYRRTLFSIFIMQLTMVGLFFLKHAFSQGYCVLALSVLTYLYKMQMRSMYTTSSSVAHHLPMELATAVDEQISEDAEADATAMLDAGLHGCLQPSLRADKATE
ncbi:hypothetical protein JL722_14133 [Aureococcus anophagefferens]|nr:hypothetical protein JL722_14133 [Aureococcus anophagefferens]